MDGRDQGALRYLPRRRIWNGKARSQAAAALSECGMETTLEHLHKSGSRRFWRPSHCQSPCLSYVPTWSLMVPFSESERAARVGGVHGIDGRTPQCLLAASPWLGFVIDEHHVTGVDV